MGALEKNTLWEDSLFELELLHQEERETVQVPSSAIASVSGQQTLTPAHSVPGVVIGQLVGFQEYVPLVIYPAQSGTAAYLAKAVISLAGEDIGAEVVLLFEAGDCSKPIIMGKVQLAAPWPLADQPAQVEVDADGRRLNIQAKEEIVLRCGKASLTLHQSGKVTIKGTHIISRSSGINRVKGAAVQIN